MQNQRTNKNSSNTIGAHSSANIDNKAHAIRKTLHEALNQVSRDQSISFSPIDSWVYMLAIPSTFRYTLDETRQIAKEIQHTILPPKKPRSLFQIVTWQEISNTHFRATPTHRDWYTGTDKPFDDGSQFVFFIETDIIKKAVLTALSKTKFLPCNHNDLASVNVSDGHLFQPVPILELAYTALWCAKDFSQVVQEWIATLDESFRLSQALFKALKSNFPNARFRSENKKIIMDSTLGVSELNYQKMVSSILFAKKTPLEWLKPLSLKDIHSYDTRAVISLRSEAHLRARPSSLHSTGKGFVLAAEKEVADRLVSIECCDEDDELRYSHFALEDKRQVSHRHFTGHSFCQDSGSSFTMGIVGDQAASILLHPEFILGALLTSLNKSKSVRVVAASEDIVVIAHSNAPWSDIEEAIRRGHSLLLKLSPDGSDPVIFDKHIDLPAHPCGTFLFTPVPNPYFDLMETAADETLALPPGRGHYLKGLAFELIREWRLAEQEFRRAFASDSTDGDISHALGRALGETGNHKEALKFLKKAAMAVPEDPEIANTYGLALLKCSQVDLAAKSFEHAVELAPDDPQFLSNLGQSYFMGQRLAEAEKILNTALEYAPSFSDAHSTLAQIRWRQGDLTGARKHARKAFAANPGNKAVQDLLWALTVDDNK